MSRSLIKDFPTEKKGLRKKGDTRGPHSSSQKQETKGEAELKMREWYPVTSRGGTKSSQKKYV